VREAADRTIELLRAPERRKSMGRSGREYVRRHFLITRYLRDYLRVFVETGMHE
jgi:trehalose synthase